MAVDEDVACRLVQALAVTIRAGLGGNVARQFITQDARVGLAVAPLKIGDDADKRLGAHFRLLIPEITKANLFFTTAKQDDVLDGFGQLCKWRIGIEFVVAGQGLQQAKIIGIAPIPATHRAGCQ